MGERANTESNKQATLTLRRQDGVVLLDVRPALSLGQLLKQEQVYNLCIGAASQKVRAGIKLNVGLSWPEDHIVTLGADKTTLGFSEDQLECIQETPLVIARRLNRLLNTHLIIDDSIIEAMPETS